MGTRASSDTETKICGFFHNTGSCKFAENCRFSHGPLNVTRASSGNGEWKPNTIPRDSRSSTSDPTKVYCGNLNANTTEKDLFDALSKYGQVLRCNVVPPRGDHFYGFGFA